ncbi:unnamed protein product, partial [Didymodactylos carnosus]
ERFQPISKSQLKKVRGIYDDEMRKEEKSTLREQEDAERRERNLEYAKNVVITEDTKLPQAKVVCIMLYKIVVKLKVKIRQVQNHHDKRVKVFGWVHRIRRQGKNLMFIVLRDGTGFLQCVLDHMLCRTYDALILSTEATVSICGIVNSVPEGKSAPGNQEMIADYWEVIGHSPSG